MGSIAEFNDDNLDWQTKAARKRQQCQEAIPKEWQVPSELFKMLKYPAEKSPNRLIELDVVKKTGILSDREHAITEDFNVSQLLAKLASGEFTSVEVTTAFSKRAAIAQQFTSCLTETFFDKALERAKYLDQCRAEGKLLGPLHGLPVSVKDGFQIIGTEASIGFVSFLGKKSTINSPLVDTLLNLGAVLYVKTNIPQTLMTADSDNNIFGRCLNPHNTALGAGGSSGGEGALVAFRGSPLGWGTDVAGSVRIPSLCCGTYGFKPSSSRIPYGGQSIPGLPGWKPITASAGPLANDFDALEISTKAVLDSVPATLDSTALDIPWRRLERAPAAKLRIGVLAEDPLYPLQPPVVRALAEAVKKLVDNGHEIIRLSPQQGGVAVANDLACQLFGLETEASANNIKASGEPVIPVLAKGYETPNLEKSSLPPGFEKMDKLHKFAALSVKRQEFSEEWRKTWSELRLDAVVSPPAQNTAVAHDEYPWPAYTCLQNLLDYPACVIPFSKSSKLLDSEPVTVQRPQVGAQYNPELQDGAPCSIQVFTSRLRDEECLEVARIVDSCLKR